MGAVAGPTPRPPPAVRHRCTVREGSRPTVFAAAALFLVAPPRPTERLRCDCLSLSALRVRRAVVLTPRAQLQEVLEDVGVSPVEASFEMSTVHVKFVLNRECLFGQQFFIVGDDPQLGLWDTSSAIPLEWSEGHVWTAQMDLPIGKRVKYKFILRGLSGEIEWQPGDDRFLQLWETTKMIVVTEEWESAEKQKIVEEELGNEVELSMVDEELTPVSKNVLADASFRTNEASRTEENLEVPTRETFITDADDETIKRKRSDNEKAVLVPGLPHEPTLVSGLPLSPISHVDCDKLAAVSEDGADSTLKLNNKGRKTPVIKETSVDEPSKVTSYNDQAVEGNEGAKDSLQASELVRNDIRWGRETLNKLLSNLGLFNGESA